MANRNWTRVLVCGLVAGGVWTLLSVAVLAVVGEEFMAAMTRGRQDAGGRGMGAFLFAANIAAGVWALWLYAALRPRYGPGPKTAIVTGVAWWVIVSMQSAKWAALVVVPETVALILLAATLPAMIVSVLIGAWLYEK